MSSSPWLAEDLHVQQSWQAAVSFGVLNMQQHCREWHTAHTHCMSSEKIKLCLFVEVWQ